jgi:hypothetical protein
MPFIRLEQETSEHIQYCNFATVLVFCILIHEDDNVEDHVALALSCIAL